MFEQDRFVVRLQQIVQAAPAIKVCFLSGSYGRRAEDGYSDVDIGLVFANETDRDTAYEDRHRFVRSVMPYVPAHSFDAAHIRPHFHIVLFSNGTKADFRYEAMTSLKPNPWDGGLRLLKDQGSWGADFAAASAVIPFPAPSITAEELEALDQRFWVMFWDTHRLVLRGDYAKAFPIYLQLFTMTLERLIPLLPSRDSERRALVAANFSPDGRATAAELRRLLEAYGQARDRIVTRFRLACSFDQAFEGEIRRHVSRSPR